MKTMAFDPADFERLNQLRLSLHNAMKAMTFDQQRDFAETMRLLLERAVPLTLPDELTASDDAIMAEAKARVRAMIQQAIERNPES